MKIDEKQLNLIVDPILDWYEHNKRNLPWRHNSTPYRVWISEIMLQQTRVDPVIPYYLRFMERFPTVEHLAEAPEDLLMKYWEGLGYYSRARNLQKAAKEIVALGEFPSDFNGWLKLPGIGKYTAGAICSIALGLPTPAVDGNVLRVLSRILGSEEDISSEKVKDSFSQALSKIYPLDKTSEFTQSLMELGATVCLPNGEPLCERCPMRGFCLARLENKTDVIPVKAPKKQRKIEEKTILILRANGKIALRRRPERGLLAKLWEFPSLDGHHEADRAIDLLGIRLTQSPHNVGTSTHVFSHIEWHMNGYEFHIDCEDERYEWFKIEELLEDIALPSAFRYYLNYLKEQRYKEI